MQKGERNKLLLLLTGVRARLVKNRDFFVSCKFIFQSGKKRYIATLTPQEGDTTDCTLTFQGTNRGLDLEGATQFFVDQVELYDTSVLEYTERGHQLVITCDKRGVSMKQFDQPVEAVAASANPLLQNSRQNTIRVDQAAPLLREIGILTADGKIKNDMIRKYNQIDHYVELVAPMFDNCSDEEIVLLDCACGKSYLSFVMNFYLRDVCKRRCKIIGIDINEHVVEESRKLAQRLGYRNMEFIAADLRTYQPPKKVTAVISLHACDIATDLALVTAIRAKAKHIACVPCCHKELLEQYDIEGLSPLLRQGVFKARFNDVLTDSLRALKLEAEGYKVSVVEYISPLDTPKNLLIRASLDKPNAKAAAEYQAVRTLLGTTSELDRGCAVTLAQTDTI